MRGTMLAVVALLGILITASVTAQEPKPVKGQGCVAAGVEASCLVVKDVKTGVLYNLIFKGTKPAAGTGIEFTGVPRDMMTTCMQGTPLEVSSWSRVDALKCSSSSAPKP
jgi:hypothetical protein